MPKIPSKLAEKLRVEANSVLKHSCPISPSITREEARALKKLRNDRSQVKLTMEKDVAMVVLDKQDYINKA